MAEQNSQKTIGNNDLRKLSRADLLEILLEQSHENESLKAKIADLNAETENLRQKLKDKKIVIEKAGTLAEATFMLNGVLDSAQQAAQQYLDNLQSLYDREAINCVQKEAETEAYVEQLVYDTQKRCEQLEKSTEQKCSAMLYAAKENCNQLREEAELYCTQLQNETKKRCLEQETRTRASCEEREKQALEKCNALEQKAKQDVERHWSELKERLDKFYKIGESVNDL